MRSTLIVCAAAALLTAPAMAELVVIDYEDLAEDFYGETFTHKGVTYRDINLVSGVFPDGSTFGPQVGDVAMIEDASIVYPDFPDFGSADKALTFGSSLIPGDNVSIGRISSVMMDLDSVSDFVSMDLLYYENGPWGGIEWHIDVLRDGAVVGGDSFTISDLGGRDNPAVGMLSVSGVEFDQIHLYATFGSEFSLPRALIDDLTLNTIPGPSGLALLFGAGVVGRRRRR